MLGGIRHLIWDTGRGLDKVSIEVLRLGHHHRLDHAHRAGLGRRLLR